MHKALPPSLPPPLPPPSLPHSLTPCTPAHHGSSGVFEEATGAAGLLWKAGVTAMVQAMGSGRIIPFTPMAAVVWREGGRKGESKQFRHGGRGREGGERERVRDESEGEREMEER